MHPSDLAKFKDLITDVMAFYRQDVSRFAITTWWQACQGFDLEQVSKAFTAHAMDPERGQYAPRPADIVRQLQGTRTDRSLLAWGKVLNTMQRVGAYSSVCFDDPLIHVAVEDLGGWVALCRTPLTDLPFLEKRFCDSFKAYASGGSFVYPSLLAGASELANRMAGHASAKPVLIGSPAAAAEVLRLGSTTSRTRITHAVEHLSALKLEMRP